MIPEEQEFDPADVMTLKAAADRLALTVDAVISAITRGKLTELIDPEPLHRFKP